jgi:hypothetical protein
VPLSASANWYIAGLEGHTYSWSTTFASPTFFIRGLGVDYTYSRSFDPYYRQGISEHQASMSYQWRALVVSTRGRYATFPVRVREVSFKISRYF